MISQLLNILQQGLRVMRLNSRLLMVGILVFVFPLLFVWTMQGFFTTAYDNINSAQKQKIGILHDSIKTVLAESTQTDDLLPVLLNNFQEANADIKKIQLFTETAQDKQLDYSTAATDKEIVKTDDLFENLPLPENDTTYIFPLVTENGRTWQAVSTVETNQGTRIIFSEHTFRLIDSLMLARQQQSYLGLTGIFLFLILLAYWLNRQTQWEKRYIKLSLQLQERDLFSNMIAHEFRTPLTAIKGYASFLQESQTLVDEERRFASNIKLSAERLVLLVNDFLEVARLQSGKIIVQKAPVDISELIDNVVRDQKISAEKKGLQLIFKQPKQQLRIDTDYNRLTQVITNLLSNAIKYTESGTIEIESQQSNKGLQIRIKDTGTGITAKDQQRLFVPFQRVGAADESMITGSGLGMWISKQLVELLGGEITVESIKGVGTHVVVSFPE